MMNFKHIMTGFFALLCISTPVLAEIQAGRAIQITVSGVPPEEKGRFDPMYPVSESGMINMPLIGQVRAAGLKSEQLAMALQSRYIDAGIYTHPTFQVFSSDEQMIAQQVVHVGGQVGHTGPVKWTKGLTLYQAIQAAGGPNAFGSMYRVKLFRGKEQKQYDLTQAKFMQILLEPSDTIEVPDKNIWSK